MAPPGIDGELGVPHAPGRSRQHFIGVPTLLNYLDCGPVGIPSPAQMAELILIAGSALDLKQNHGIRRRSSLRLSSSPRLWLAARNLRRLHSAAARGSGKSECSLQPGDAPMSALLAPRSFFFFCFFFFFFCFFPCRNMLAISGGGVSKISMPIIDVSVPLRIEPVPPPATGLRRVLSCGL